MKLKHLSLTLFISLLFLILIINVKADSTFFDNGNDAFVMGNSQTTPATGGVIGGTTGGGGCRYEWSCTNWSECLSSGKQTRTCTNIGTCSDTYKAPEIEQNCTYTVPEVEKRNETEKQMPEEPPIPEYHKETEGQQQPPITFQVIVLAMVIILIGCIYYYFIKRSKKD